MKNVIISILIILIIVIMGMFMLTTCPKEQDHKDAICLAINKAVDEKLGDSSLSFAGVINYGSKFAIKQIASLFIDSNVTVDNYVFWSVGLYTFNGRNNVISIGMFNHVFTMSKDDILDELEKQGL